MTTTRQVRRSEARSKAKIQTRVLRLYTPHSVQLAVHMSKARFRVASWGRQSGKSTCCLNEILRYAWEHEGVTLWFISPTEKQAKVQYRRLVGMLWKCQGILLKKNQTELRVKLFNQSQIKFVSGEVLDKLRGETLHGVVIDEVRDQHPELWSMVIRPMLATTGGWAMFVSTPRGFDQFYDLAKKAMSDLIGKWEFFKAPSTCNPLFTEEEYQDSKKDMSEAEFAQEIDAEFRNITSGKAYSSAGEHNKLMSSPFCKDGALVSPYLPVVVGLDFNVGFMRWHLGQFKGPSSYWFDAVEVNETNTQECAPVLVEKLVALRDAGLLKQNPMVRICGDATGESRNTKATQSDYDIICKALDDEKITWSNDTLKSNPPVKTRVNTMNARLKAADGTITLHYHPINCKALDRDFDRVVWKPGTNELDQTKDKSLTHSSDGVGYPVCVFSPIELGGTVGTLKTITRRG